MGNTNEQMHGINLNEGSEDIRVEQVDVFQSAGDGIRFLGRAQNKVRRVWVERLPIRSEQAHGRELPACGRVRVGAELLHRDDPRRAPTPA